jgi:hypothetical protein
VEGGEKSTHIKQSRHGLQFCSLILGNTVCLHIEGLFCPHIFQNELHLSDDVVVDADEIKVVVESFQLGVSKVEPMT